MKESERVLINDQFYFCQGLESNTVPAAGIEKDQHLELKVQPHNFCDARNGLCLHHHKHDLTTSSDNPVEVLWRLEEPGLLVKT